MTHKSMMIVLLLTAIGAGGAASAQDGGARPLRYGNTSSWSFDARNDQRDFPTNGFFPGNFAANPPYASVGAAGFLESNPYRSATPYPSQVYFGPQAGRSGSCHHSSRSVSRRMRRRC